MFVDVWGCCLLSRFVDFGGFGCAACCFDLVGLAFNCWLRSGLGLDYYWLVSLGWVTCVEFLEVV